MILGTSKILSKYGPSDPVLITKNTSKHIRNYGNILEKYYFHSWESETSSFFKTIERCIHHFLGIVVWILSFFLEHMNIYFYINLRRGGSGNDTFSINNISKSLDRNFISIKNMKWKYGKSYKLFYFQERESSNINSLIVKKWKGIIQY